MLADQGRSRPAFGALSAAVHSPGTSRQQIVLFIEQELTGWRDDPDRPFTSNEDRLNDSLGLYLQSAARHRLDIIQFLREPCQSANRNCDLGVFPASTIEFEG